MTNGSTMLLKGGGGGGWEGKQETRPQVGEQNNYTKTGGIPPNALVSFNIFYYMTSGSTMLLKGGGGWEGKHGEKPSWGAK